MKFAVMSNSNGTFKIESEWTDNLSGAKTNFWDKCKTFENAPDVNRAVVVIVNENYDVVDDKKEIITHEVEE
jgi:hypothetical protein